jgi:hypothetical protein
MIQKEAELIGFTNGLSRMAALGEMSPEDKRKSVYGEKN